MNTNDSLVLDVMRRSMVARIATLSRNGRPSITPLYFTYQNGHIWLGTVDWTLAARNIKADPRVSLLFEVEQAKTAHQILRIRGRASVRTGRKVQRLYGLRVLCKYILTPGGIHNMLVHIRQIPFMRKYRVQAAMMGQPCVIEVTPLQAEFLNGEKLG